MRLFKILEKLSDKECAKIISQNYKFKRNEDHETLLMVAAKNEKIKTVKVLLTKESIFCENIYGYNALTQICVFRKITKTHIKIAELLIKKDNRIIFEESDSKYAPLQLLFYGHRGNLPEGAFELGKLLIENGAYIGTISYDYEDKDYSPYYSSLYLSITKNHIEFIEYLMPIVKELGLPFYDYCLQAFVAYFNCFDDEERKYNIIYKFLEFDHIMFSLNRKYTDVDFVDDTPKDIITQAKWHESLVLLFLPYVRNPLIKEIREEHPQIYKTYIRKTAVIWEITHYKTFSFHIICDKSSLSKEFSQ